MPFAPMNIILEKTLAPKETLSLPYPQGKNEGHFFGGMNHTLSIEGNFFRSPRDFTLLTQHDHILFTWQGSFSLAARTLLNIQAEIPGGDFYFDSKIGVTVANMVLSPLFMVNLSSPPAVDDQYWVASGIVSEGVPLLLANKSNLIARNISVCCDTDNSRAVFTVEGEDLYRRSMIENIAVNGIRTEGRKAFSQVHRITASPACSGSVSLGTGSRFGLPVFLPSPGYLIREIINGEATTGGTVTGGETLPPTATTGDRRGTYSPPDPSVLDGKHSIHLLLSLLAPGNIGVPDFAG